MALHVVGRDGGNFGNLEIVLQGLPATATLSRGERRDAVTWVLSPADLGDLHVNLGEVSPAAFDVRIDVVAPPDVPTIGSIARIRVVDAAVQERSTAAAVEGPERRVGLVAGGTSVAKSVPVQAAAATVGPTAAADAKAKRPTAERRTATETEAAVAAPQAVAQSWPEGASALGATSRQPERQVWWTMPQPSWSPFQEQTGTQ